MSHYLVVVTNTDKVNLDEQLEPFSENIAVEPYKTYNPNSKWDWYQVGGRWTGFFKNKKGAKGKVMQIPENLKNFYRPAKRGHSDIIKVKDVDFDKTELPYGILHNGDWISVETKDTRKDFEKAYKKIIKSLPDDCELTAVDCHI